MQIDVKRRTGFFGMASPIQLIQDGRQIASVRHDASQTVEIDPIQPLKVKMMLLRSQPYMLKERKTPVTLEIILNPLLKRFYFISYGVFFLIAGVSGLFYAQCWLWLLLISLILLYSIGLRYYLVRGFIIKEVDEHGEWC
ncbi:hypothetical protein A5886_001569 [Enterococcus sp. 8G7_MSG3316]|uniref:Uncharacterized protein n=1 Tax=Candidatus Enterococcus testudinis TaxID=1834191 RepID=A0A242A6B4_9ENTE|nr:hypothetical protein [Enterococcus sp. 8G7_MSG3316]OTN76492.1 hypothetical protein A5886_001569 [Enterococcus sp. 8G7_MSG3316]